MTNIDQTQTQQPAPQRAVLGLPIIAIIGLALLAAPRVVLHDLGLITEETLLNAVFVFIPPAVWIAVVLIKRIPKPFLTLLVVGAFYGVFLALGHQLLWDASFGGNPPSLGGNLTNVDPGIQSVILRSFAAVSSMFTGVIVGAITGLIAWGLNAATHRAR